MKNRTRYTSLAHLFDCLTQERFPSRTGGNRSRRTIISGISDKRLPRIVLLAFLLVILLIGSLVVASKPNQAKTLAIAAALSGNGVIGWGSGSEGQLNIPVAALSDVTAIAAGNRHSLVLKNGAVSGWGFNAFGQVNIPVAAQSGVTAIAAGANHSLALKSGGVIVWGYSLEGQLTPPVAAQSGVTAIAAGGNHSLALKNGAVIGWGRNDSGQVNIPVAAQSGVTAIAAGSAHSMALKSTGQVIVWGNNDFSQLSLPSAVQSGVTAISAGQYHGLALKNGAVIGWGYNGQNQVTIPAAAQSGVTAISAGALFSLALKNGTVIGWGGALLGQSIIPVAAQSGVISISAGENHSLALKPLSPPAITAGAALTRQQGSSSISPIATVSDGETAPGSLVVTATSLPAGITVTSITNTAGAITATIAAGCTAALGANTVGLTVTDGGGESVTANLTVNVTGNTLPTLTYSAASVITGASTFKAPTTASDNGSIASFAVLSSGTFTGSISVNSAGVVSILNAAPIGNHTVTIRATDNCGAIRDATFTLSVVAMPNSAVTGWGDNANGQVNAPVAAKSGVTAIAAGSSHSLALKNGGVIGWGSNTSNQLTIPVEAQSGVTAIAAKSFHSLALKNGGVIGWGSNGSGQVTIPVAAQSGVTAIAAGGNHSLALKNGGVIGWGNNVSGQVNTPASAQSGVIAIAAGQLHSLALTSNGRVIGWGGTAYGQTTIPTAAQSGVVAIAAGGDFSMALKSTGEVLGWGSNAGGQLPIPVAAQSGVVAISAGYAFCLALKSTGQVIGWGYNNDGQVTIPTVAQSGVLAIAAGSEYVLALKPVSPPSITVGAALARPQGSSAVSTIATVSDAETPAASVVVTATTVPAGLTVTSITNTAGAITATVAATCTATPGAKIIVLTATDGNGEIATASLTVNVTANTAPALVYLASSVIAGNSINISPNTAADNGAISSYALQSRGSYTGTISVNSSGVVSISNAVPVGSHTITIRATDNCGAITDSPFTLMVNCPTITLSPSSLPSATMATEYNQTIVATPAGTYSFAVTSGAMPTGLTLNPNTGAITGSPTQSGSFNFRITATRFGVCTGFRDYMLMVHCMTPTIDPASLPPAGIIGFPFNRTISVTPSMGYVFSVSSGMLPAGLTLNASTGAITGTPTTTGAYSFMIRATAGSCWASQSFTLTINCPTILFETPAVLPLAQNGMAYSQTLIVQQPGSYTFSILSGSLPMGISLDPQTGTLSGMAMTSGTYYVNVKAQTAAGCSGSRQFTLHVGCPGVTIFPTSLSAGSSGTNFIQQFSADPTGGNYSYRVSAGALPQGLTLNTMTGLLSGTPTIGGTFNFTITATGFGSCTGARAYTLMINGGVCPTITLPSLPNGTPGQLYNYSVMPTPSGSYNFAVTAGSLPPGLALYSMGMIYGYPTAAGTYNFTLKATDSNNCTGSKSYTMIIGGGATQSMAFGDFDGDGKADLSVWRGQSGDWLTVNSTDGRLNTEAWGSSAAPYYDVMVSGDYDGDGRMDAAVFRKSTGEWLIKGSKDGAVTARVWGLGTDVPVPGDYDGDGRTDLAVWRGTEGNWYILCSTDGHTEAISWGTHRAPYSDVPVASDYDGDGKTDVAVFRQANGHWYIKLSSDGSMIDKAWGLGTDVPVVADYDGDGKADIAVWRGAETNWYILLSGQSADSAVQTISWGTSSLGDVPVPGDYDGDGKADATIWRASTGMWYVKHSSDNTEMSKAHGQSGDVPTAAKRTN